MPAWEGKRCLLGPPERTQEVQESRGVQEGGEVLEEIRGNKVLEVKEYDLL